MLKINDIEVTKEDMEDLLGAIQTMKRSLNNGDINNVDFMLEVLEKHLKHNLLQDES